MADGLKRAAGLWAKTGKQGGRYLTGKAEIDIPAGSRLMIFENNYKTTGSQEPDYRLLLDAGNEQPPMRRAEHNRREQDSPADVLDDDIPF